MADTSIANLYEWCTLHKHVLPGAPASVCNQLASSAVRMPDGELQYRCGAHEGIQAAIFGEVVTRVRVVQHEN